jgi:adenylate kinase family enzyme
MQRVLIFGNSGSGKSTLSKKMAQAEGLAHMDFYEQFPGKKTMRRENL